MRDLDAGRTWAGRNTTGLVRVLGVSSLVRFKIVENLISLFEQCLFTQNIWII